MDYIALANALCVEVDRQSVEFLTILKKYKEQYGVNLAVNFTYRDFIIADIKRLRSKL